MNQSCTGFSSPRPCVDEIPERVAAPVSHPVVEEQLELAFPEPTRRNFRHVWREEHLPQSPERAARREWLLPEDVEHCATETPALETMCESRLIHECTTRHIYDDCVRREAIHSCTCQDGVGA